MFNLEKILSFCNKPVITHAPLDTYVLSILQAEKDVYLNWIVSNYINIKFCINDNNYDTFCPTDLLLQCPYLSYSTLSYRDLLCDNFLFSQLCKSCIDNNQYIYGYLNMKYIPDYNCKIDEDHNLILFGYNEAQVYAADFFNFSYSTKLVDFENLDNAFFNLKNVEHFGKENDYLDENILFHFIKKNLVKTKYDSVSYCVSEIKNETRNFLESKNTNMEINYVYGLTCLDLCEDIDKLSVRQLSLFYSICKMWIIRINFLLSNDVISLPVYKSIKYKIDLCTEISKINLMLFVKFYISKNCGRYLDGYPLRILEGIKKNRHMLLSFCEELVKNI